MLSTGMRKRIMVCLSLLTAICVSRTGGASMLNPTIRFDVVGLNQPVDILIDP
jgi:hypothetical protein